MPGFLKRADQKLLLNKPGIWSTRAHLVVYYGILFLFVLTVICFLEPNDPRDYSTMEAWIGFVSIVSGIGFIVWMIYLLRFNVFKKYGIIHPLHGLVTFFLYFMASGILVSFPYVHPIVESVRANNTYTDEEIIRDVNNINIKIFQVEYDKLKEPWQYHRIQLVASVKKEVKDENEVDDPVTSYIINDYRYDSSDFYTKINEADSIVKVKDSVYLVYNTPDYSFLSPYLYWSKANDDLLSAFEIFKKVNGHPPTPAERETITRELDVLLKKYYYKHSRYYYNDETITGNELPLEMIRKKYRLGKIDNSISHIMMKKSRWRGNDKYAFMRVFYYVTLGITLLIFIFRHSSIRTFWLSVLTGVLLTIITAMILGFSRADAIHFLSFMIVYVLLFFFGSLAVWKAKRRMAITGICINLFVFIVTAFPLLVYGWCYEYKKYQLDHDGWVYKNLYNFEEYVIYAEVGGAVILLLLLATYISKVYRHWFALPED
ncbi:hypothetical protein [Niastella populi]|nr:hypothetical protein [Niastella populi]